MTLALKSNHEKWVMLLCHMCQCASRTLWSSVFFGCWCHFIPLLLLPNSLQKLKLKKSRFVSLRQEERRGSCTIAKKREWRPTERTEVNNWDERVNDREGERWREAGGGRSPQSSQAMFEAGSWLDNRGSFIPQTQWANATMGVMPRAGLHYTEPHTQD